MAYRRPAVTVIQEFIGLVPALAPFTLPTVAVGPCYQLVDNDLVGTYSGVQRDYEFASMMPGAHPDIQPLDPKDPMPATKKPVSMVLKNVELGVVAESTTGAASGVNFTDATPNKFQNVQAGDVVVVMESEEVVVVEAQTDGASVSTPGSRDVLTAGTAGQFANVKAGDSVTVVSGTNTNTGTYSVLVNVGGNSIKLDGDINTGGGAASDVAYHINGNRGTDTAGNYVVRSVTDKNTLVLQSAFEQAEAPLTYMVKRKVSQLAWTEFSVSEDGVSMAADLQTEGYPILAADVRLSYRALRNDKASSIRQYSRLADLQADFGVTQITPQNPLAYGLSIMLQNTTTPVYGLGLDENAIPDETLSYQRAADVLAQSDMYAIVPLTQNPVIHQSMKAHVEGMSSEQKERVVLVNRTLKREETVQLRSTMETGLPGSRVVVNTQLAGSVSGLSLNVLNDATADVFMNVLPGDTLVVVGGATEGNYVVESKTNSNSITLDSNIATGSASGVSYYIARQDGLGADGVTLYDRSATFISDGIAAGMMVRIFSGELAGDHKIASVVSETTLSLAQVPGVTSLQTGLDYSVVRELTKYEQSEFLKGYSAALASRRVVNVWPDVLVAPVGQVLQDLPGFYGACALGGMTSGLPTQQGFTNLSISGFLGLRHSSGYFNDDLLDNIADGGTLILAQDVDQAPLYVRHQLSTDRSAIKFQEYSFTKNVDYVSKFLRKTYAGFIGKWNIVDSTKDELRSTAKAALSFLKDDTRLPRIGGVIKGGRLTQLVEDPANIDTLLMTFALDMPIPLNNLKITVQV